MSEAEALTCLDCGMTDPPPEQTCRNDLDHRVGYDRGCPNCGRLMAACLRSPCSAWRAVEAALEGGTDDDRRGR